MNLSKFLEFEFLYETSSDNCTSGNVTYWTTALNEDAAYVIFNSYHECAVIGVLPLIGLSVLNYSIYAQIRKSAQLNQR